MEEVIRFFNGVVFHSVSLIVILNPLSAGAVMLSLLGNKPEKEAVRKIGFKSSLTIFVSMLLTFFLGKVMIRFFGISVDSIEVIGGAVLFLMAINMINGKESSMVHSKDENEHAKEKDDISVIPLAIPILFGPGMMATMITIKNKTTTWEELVSVLVAILFASGVTYLVLKNMIYIYRYLGITGVKITSRIMGLVVGALATQFIISGVKVLFKQ